MSDRDGIHIAVVTDDNYAQHLGVMLTSLLEHTRHRESIQIYTLTGGLGDANKQKLEQIVGGYNASIEFLSVDPALFSGFGVRNKMSHAAYYKLALPELFKDRLKKLIFLDCDIIVKKDISDLWATQVADYALAAVKQPFFNRHSQLYIPETVNTFNSGVMVINVDEWVEKKVFDRSIKFLEKNSHHIVFHDQDALNAVLYDSWVELDPRWNQLTSFLYADYRELSWSQEKWNKVYDHPYIVHYSSTKPWYFLNDHPYKNEYYEFLNKTPWNHYIPPDQENAQKLLGRDRIIVYGTGTGGERVFKKLQDFDVEVTYYIDGDSSKWGGQFFGKPIRSPDTLQTEDKDQIAIFIASYSYYEEMARKLERMGFREGEHYMAGFGRR